MNRTFKGSDPLNHESMNRTFKGSDPLKNDADAYGVAREAKSNGLKRPFAMIVGQIDWLPW